MKTKIKTQYPHHVVEDHCSDIYIADHTEQTKAEPVKRGVEITTTAPTDIKSFLIRNNKAKAVPFSSVTFDDKSFTNPETGETLSQCECICFSAAEYDKGPWMLLLELKYCKTSSQYQKQNMEKAKEQLISTYHYYKQKGLINSKQQCYLVASFPGFRPPFPNFINTQAAVREMRLKKVIFRGVNELKIKNEFKLEI